MLSRSRFGEAVTYQVIDIISLDKVMRLSAEVILTHPQRRVRRVEKTKAKWSGDRDKPHVRPRHQR